MFGFTTRPAKTRGQLMRDELGTSWEHLMQAANHAAGGVGATVALPAAKARTVANRGYTSTMAALTPLAEAYRTGVQDATAALNVKAKVREKEKQMSRKKVGMLVGLLAAGAAVGAAGALVMRRRRQQQWSEYDPSQSLESMKSDGRSMVGKMSSKAESAIDKTASTASRTFEKAGDKLHAASSSIDRSKGDVKDKVGDMADSAGDSTDAMADKIHSATKNSRF